MSETPEWYNESKLVKINYEERETGWAISVGDGKYRLANNPIRGVIGKQSDTIAQWGDLVELVHNNGDESWLKVIEKYVHEG